MGALLELNHIKKSFGSHTALKDFNFQVFPGEILGLIGENGAGKSTAMNIAFGLYPPDSGSIRWQGKEVHFHSPADAQKAGIGMVHQHFMLSPRQTVLENVLLAYPSTPFQWINKKEWVAKFSEKLQEFGFEDLPWDQRIENLSVGQQQQIEIFKSLLFNPKFLILDEPTAVLTPQEVQKLFQTLKSLQAQGTSIVIISHKLKEILEITDRVYVLRHGQMVKTAKTKESSLEDLASAMVGERWSSLAPSTPLLKGPLVLNLKNLKLVSDGHRLQIDQLNIHQGEVVGVAGVEGNGQTLLIQSILHPRSQKSLQGKVEFLGENITHSSTDQILQKGLRSLPEDRLRWGVLPEASALENFVLGHQEKFKTSLWMDWEKASSAAQKSFDEFDVRPRSLKLRFKNFSGGNQQKIVVARELMKTPKFLLASHPTRGVDLGSAQFIRKKIKEVAKSGAVMVISSDLDELFEICDRLVVLYKGRLNGEFHREDFNEEKIGRAMAGGTP